MTHEIYISRDVDDLGFENAEELISKAVNMALDAENVTVPCLIDAVLTDNEGIRATNREFRQVDAATPSWKQQTHGFRRLLSSPNTFPCTM